MYYALRRSHAGAGLFKINFARNQEDGVLLDIEYTFCKGLSQMRKYLILVHYAWH